MLFGTTTVADGAAALLKEVGLDEAQQSAPLKSLAAANSRYLKDLKLNITTALNAESLGKKEAYLLAYAVAVNEKNVLLQDAFEKSSRDNGATDAEVAETIACTSLMNANNVY